MGRGIRSVFLGAVLLLGLLGLAFPVHAQETIDIAGQVLNGTLDAEVPQGLTVTLQVFRSGENLETRETVPDDQGRFLFDGVVGGEEYGYIITTQYAGSLYSYETDYVRLSMPVELTVYETTTSSEAIRGTGHTLLVDGADSKSQLMSVFEIVVLKNTDDRTFVPEITAGGPMDFLRFSLPPTARELNVGSSLQGGQIIQVNVGFAITSPVPPGTHELQYSYVAPYENGKLVYGHSFPFGTDVFRVFLPQGLGRVRGAGLQEVEPLLFGDRVFQQLETGALEAGARVTLEFSGLSQPALWQRWRDAMPGGDLAIGAIPGAFGLALLTLLAYALLRRGRLARTASLARGSAGQRSAVIEAMARLDDQFQRREMGREEYLQRRRELRERLLPWEGRSAPGREGPPSSSMTGEGD